MLQESEKCQLLRRLISPSKRDENWYDSVAEVTDIPGYDLKHALDVAVYFKKEWGTLEPEVYDEKDCIVWRRSDNGLAIYDTTPIALNEKIIKFILYGHLMEEIKSQGFLSYVAVGTPPDWRKCRVYVNGNLKERVVWACALTGKCERLAKGPESHTVIDSGYVIIKKEETDLGFF